MINVIRYENQTAEELFGRREELADVENEVQKIVSAVKERGDRALQDYCLRFDGFSGALEVTDGEFEAAFQSLSPEYLATLRASIENIKKFHSLQMPKGFEIDEGDRRVGQKVTAVARAGIYVPGGTAAYPSTVLMNAVPAKIAGVRELFMATPAKSDGKIKSEVLAAAKLCGVDRVFKMGGAQAIAAFAYGTQSVPKVDKITGPGNVFVATAKKLVSGTVCGIDMIAGPSEILVIADGGANPAYVAADLLSQAEHDERASALLITENAALAQAVAAELERQLAFLERREIARKSLEDNGKIIVCENLSAALKIADEYAPEHLELCVRNPFELLPQVKNAGSVFLGYHTPEAVGDYYAGANHTLPTGGTARFSSPLSVNDFLKTTQYVYYTPQALSKASADICRFAESEGLGAHARSVSVRTNR